MTPTDAARCADEAGRFTPRIDRNRCEAKADCVRVCPYHVFEIHPLGAEEKRGLSLLGRLEALAHGGKQAFAVSAEACHACGLCVKACPENAIRLVRV
jgi:NAD-dependent dihydropyrimidine dehydrogenase PreA subunit